MLYKLFWLIVTAIYRLWVKKIGWLSYIGMPIFIKGCRGIYIENRVRIFPGLRMEVYNGGSIVIEEDVSIGQRFHITSSNMELRIGRSTTISGNVFITNIDHEYQELNLHILKQKYLVQKTQIGENCFIGYGSAIQAGTILGKQCIVGANSVVRGVFPDYCVIVGVPARVVKKYNLITNKWEKV